MQMFEQLEARRLMTTVATFSDGLVVSQASDGTLTVKNPTSSKIVNVNVIENGISQTTGVNVGLGNVLVQDNVTGQEAVAYKVNVKNAIAITGGAGGDTLNYDGTTTHANIQGGTGADSITVLDRGNGGSVASTSGRGYLLNLVFSNHATLNGGGADDTIIVDSCYDTADGGTGTPSGSVLQSTNKIVVNSQGGNDTIIQYGGTSAINAGDGNDTIYIYNNSNATVDGGKGTDVLHKSATAVVTAKNCESVLTDL